jgi:hypothetical protein
VSSSAKVDALTLIDNGEFLIATDTLPLLVPPFGYVTITWEYEHMNLQTLVQILPFFNLWGWSGTKSTITATIYWPIAPVMEDR